MEYRIKYDTKEHVWLCVTVEESGNCIVNKFVEYDQVFAWLRLMVGDYPGTQEAS